MEKVSQIKFQKLETLDPECRCCGKGREYICDRCFSLLQENHLLMLEVTDASNSSRKKFTGYVVAVDPSVVVKESEHSEVKMQTKQLYFIRESDLKQFLKDGYNKSVAGKFLNGAPSISNDRRAAAGSRHPVELAVERGHQTNSV